jgi:lipopolysaccharide/colanic/teichoic acid biosynthesis glycosyltransferase
LVRSLGPSARIQLARARRLFGATGTRVLDVCIASAGLALLSLPMLLVAAAIRLTSLGPAIFRQRRVGKYGRLFTIYKFRTMHQNALMRLPEIAEMNHHGIGSVSFKVVRDPRVTPIGRWLRKSSIDELPQLWNVLRGDMSLVGPRPPLPAEVLRYTEEQRRRLWARPGLTGLSQISGRADLTFEKQVVLDLFYLRHRNLRLDCQILLKTVRAVLSAEGAY